ncbi:MAG TPA: tetraacyldisaccharide 4'-kinase [Flavitalea sp.]|nr:tetraacyldisaccharide 4'-kinase [Flavitalea sp.]
MNFNAPLLRPIRMLLFPFSLLYALAVWIRNKLYDSEFYSSISFNMPVIGIGNLSAGGTGKSPMVEFLMMKFMGKYQMAVLSRGYKRKTTGYALANEQTTALEIGDEPMQFFKKFPKVTVAVGEERAVAIPQLLHDRPGTQVIVLDDSFQHRAVKPGLNILLTDYHNLFTRDWFLPTGDLRDQPGSYKRADVLVVTKCPSGLSEKEKSEIARELNVLDRQQLFFTSIKYGYPYHIITRKEMLIDEHTEALLISGVADPRPLKKYLSDQSGAYYEILYDDHHIFTIDDWKDIRKRFDSIHAPNKIILTTEKDAVRLMKFQESLARLPVYVIPIQIQFLFGDEERFSSLIATFIARFANKTVKN